MPFIHVFQELIHRVRKVIRVVLGPIRFFAEALTARVQSLEEIAQGLAE